MDVAPASHSAVIESLSSDLLERLRLASAHHSFGGRPWNILLGWFFLMRSCLQSGASFPATLLRTIKPASAASNGNHGELSRQLLQAELAVIRVISAPAYQRIADLFHGGRLTSWPVMRSNGLLSPR